MLHWLGGKRRARHVGKVMSDTAKCAKTKKSAHSTSPLYTSHPIHPSMFIHFLSTIRMVIAVCPLLVRWALVCGPLAVEVAVV